MIYLFFNIKLCLLVKKKKYCFALEAYYYHLINLSRETPPRALEPHAPKSIQNFFMFITLQAFERLTQKSVTSFNFGYQRPFGFSVADDRIPQKVPIFLLALTHAYVHIAQAPLLSSSPSHCRSKGDSQYI